MWKIRCVTTKKKNKAQIAKIVAKKNRKTRTCSEKVEYADFVKNAENAAIAYSHFSRGTE